MASCPSGSCEGENLRMCVQMAQPEPHCQGLGVRSPEAGSGRQQTGSGVKSNRTPKGPGTTEAPGVCVSTGQMSQVCVERGMKSGQVPRDPDVKWGCMGRVTPVPGWLLCSPAICPCWCLSFPSITQLLIVLHGLTWGVRWVESHHSSALSQVPLPLLWAWAFIFNSPPTMLHFFFFKYTYFAMGEGTIK